MKDPAASHRTFEMSICPVCLLVHELGGTCIFNCPGSSPFNGFIDDLTVWNRTLTQGEIRAMNYLDRGLNGIVVPRVLFFQSQFFSSLNTTTFSYSSPIVGATAIGNSNPRELNARTIQQLIAANLTLAQAWTWIDQLCRNDTGNLTSFPLVVTSEIYTIGFDAMVLNVLPNVTVENSGNSSVPPPPIRQLSFWEAVWNSFTGLVSALWNAVVAVATFVANVALAVVKWCIDFAVAIMEGRGLEFFYDTVVKPFVDAILAFIRWIIDMALSVFNAFINAVLRPIIEAYDRLSAGLLKSCLEMTTDLRAGGTGTDSQHSMSGLFSGNDMLVMYAVFTALVMTIIVIGFLTLPFSFVVGMILGLLVGLVITALLSFALNLEKGTNDDGPDSIDGLIDYIANIIEKGQLPADPLSDDLRMAAKVFSSLAAGFAGAVAIMKAEPTGILALVTTFAIASLVMKMQWNLNNEPESERKAAQNIVSFALVGVSLMLLLMTLIVGKWKALETTPPYRQGKHCSMAFSAIAMGFSLVAIGASMEGY